MTSIERKEIRYQRRKNKRIQRKQRFQNSLLSYSEIFTFHNLYKAFKLCKNGVMWKSSMQSYESNLLINISDLYTRLNNHTYKSKGFHHFTINERGKLRHIRSVNIDERIVQRCLCDNFLIPLLRYNLIYDNGATLKGKGTDFTISRLKKHLHEYSAKNGKDGYIITFDFSDYFNSIKHNKIYKKLDTIIEDENTKNLVHHLVDNFGDNGLGLGSQISQIIAVAFPNELDHMFKDQLGVKYYGRYMDDGYIICDSKSKAKFYINVLYKICNKHEIQINERKIHVSKISKPFTLLKKKIFVDDNCKIVIKVIRKNITRERQKLKKYKKKMTDGSMSYKEIENAYKSWKGNIRKYNSYHIIKNMDKLFNDLFIKDWRIVYE